jgi:hypothetical protein
MKALKFNWAPAVAVAAVCAALAAGPLAAQTASSGSDQAFNDMVGQMAGRDTGSGWLDYYVDELNQRIAFQQTTQPYGVAGPNGPFDGFEGYVAGFRMPDTGSAWFNSYLDAINFAIRQKQQWMMPSP